MITETQNTQPSVNVYPSANGGGFGDMFGGMGGGAIFFWLILFFFMMMFMGWGNNNGNASGGVQYVPYAAPMYGMGGGYGAADAVRQGFDQAAVINGITGLGNTIQTGFSNAEVSRCNQQANILATMNNNQNALTAVLNNQAMALQNCCCENRANIAQVRYDLATEACADRNAVKDALQDLTAQNNQNLNAMATMFNNGIQNLKDEFCQLRLDSKDQRIADLERQLTASQTASLVNNSRDAIMANDRQLTLQQTADLEQYLSPVPRPAYIVQNPNGCNCNNGCNNYYNRCCGQ